MSRLAIYLLGPPRIERVHHGVRDGEAFHIPRRKALALLAYLAVEPGRHNRDVLATLFWPDYDQTGARGRLRRTLSSLNRALGEGWLTADRELVGLNADASLWLDVDQFRQRLAACEPHGHAPNETCPDCLARLSEAVELYRDDFMAGCSLLDSLAFDEWQLLHGQALRAELAGALERLVCGHQALGQYETTLPFARRWVALDPLHEPAHRHVMELYARTGQASAALHQYEFCETTLAKELGVRPSQETRALYEHIRSGKDLGPARTALSYPAHDLPPQPTPFVGREAELARIARRLADPSCRLLTLVGPGGIGKTRLALQAALEIAEFPAAGTRFSHGIVFVPLVAVDAPDALVPAIARALNFSFYRGTDPKQQLLDYLRAKSMLLVLDNFEQLLHSSVGERGSETGEQLVSDILAAAPAVKILVTSREALNIQREWFHPVEGMHYPVGVDLPEEEAATAIDEYEAIALFAECARRARPGFSLADERPAVIRICKLVEGMPLAIELAAAWLKALPPTKIAAEIERGLDILSTSLKDVAPRHRTMRAVFDHSWTLLSAREREVLGVLSVFRGGFRSQASEAVAGTSLQLLSGLVEKSLLRVNAAGRYQMHELLRQFAADKLEENAEQKNQALDRHSAYYTTLVQEHGQALRGAEQKYALAEMEAEIENTRAAWNRAVERTQVQRLDQAVDGLCRFYEWRGLFREGEAACREAEARLVTLEGPTLDVSRTLAKTLAWQGAFNWVMGRNERAGQLLRQSMDILDSPELAAHDTRSQRAFVLQQLGEMTRHADRERSRLYFEESLGYYREVGDQWAVALLLERLGAVNENLADYEQARSVLEECLAIRRSLGDRLGVGHALWWLSIVFGKQGHYERADDLVRESIAICQALDDRAGVADGQQNLGSGLMLRGRYADAQALLEEAAATHIELGMRYWYAVDIGLLAWAKASLGLYEAADELSAEARSLFTEIGDREGMALCCQCLAEVALAEQAYGDARELLEECVALFREIGQRDYLGEALADLASAERALGQPPEMQSRLREALAIATGIGARLPKLSSIAHFALLLADQDQPERAIELYALASRYPFIGNSQLWEDIVGRHVAAAAKGLPPEVVAAAQERGKARDLDATLAELLAELEVETRGFGCQHNSRDDS